MQQPIITVDSFFLKLLHAHPHQQPRAADHGRAGQHDRSDQIDPEAGQLAEFEGLENADPLLLFARQRAAGIHVFIAHGTQNAILGGWRQVNGNCSSFLGASGSERTRNP